MATMAVPWHRMFGACFRGRGSSANETSILTIRLWAVFVVALLAVCASSRTQAQTAGTITGTVTDPTGAVVPSAKVTITNTGTGTVARTLQTNGSGAYVAEALPVGAYEVAIEASGFQRAVPRLRTGWRAEYGHGESSLHVDQSGSRHSGGVQGPDQQLQCEIRHRRRSLSAGRDQVGSQRFSRRPLRIPSER